MPRAGLSRSKTPRITSGGEPSRGGSRITASNEPGSRCGRAFSTAEQTSFSRSSGTLFSFRLSSASFTLLRLSSTAVTRWPRTASGRAKSPLPL